VEQEYVPGGLVPSAPTVGELNARVVFVPLGYGPAVAARAARLALLNGMETTEAYVATAVSRPGSSSRGTE
jgi:hypothetical protein